jgi:uncharacterized membrane protein YbaN (DUF454 family)
MQASNDETISGSLKKGIYFVIGSISLVAGIIGIFLPVIPTTPFVLLSAWCFFRSSEKIYQWVISNKRFGPTIENYQEGRGITLNTKIRAVVMMWLTITLSIYFFISNLYIIALLYSISISVTFYIYKLPTLEEKGFIRNNGLKTSSKGNQMYKTKYERVILGIFFAFVLWYFVFLSNILLNFWYRVTSASILLMVYAYSSGRINRGFSFKEVIFGLFFGFLLYVLFYIGFNVFRPLVEVGAVNVYQLSADLPLIFPAVLLLITSFCEEYFWRYYIQRNLVIMFGVKGVLLTSLLYASIHIVTFNLPLVFAALIAGTIWGILYWYTDSIWTVIFSHIMWTELIFVFFPLK